MPAKGGEGIGSRPELCENLAFNFTRLTVKYAWEIGTEDFESAGINPEYEPYIPEEIDNAPVLKVLERKRGLGNEEN